MKRQARWTTAALLLGGASTLGRADEPRHGEEPREAGHGPAEEEPGAAPVVEPVMPAEPAVAPPVDESKRTHGNLRANGEAMPDRPHKDEEEIDPSTLPQGRQTSFSTNPNRRAGLSSDNAAIRDTPRSSPLSATDEVLVNSLRARLQALDEREAAVAAREAALRGVVYQLQAESDRLAALRSAVDVAVDRRDARVQAACTELVSIERQRDRERREWERATLAESRRVQLASEDEHRKTLVVQAELAATAARLECVELQQKASERDAKQALNDSKQAAAKSSAETAKLTADEMAAEEAAKARAERVAELGKIVKKMKPDEAARLLADQNDAVALGVLAALGPRTSAKVIARMPTARANGLTKALIAGGAP